jgi:hypothetical protein
MAGYEHGDRNGRRRAVPCPGKKMRNRGELLQSVAVAGSMLAIVTVAAAFGWQLGRKDRSREAHAEQAVKARTPARTGMGGEERPAAGEKTERYSILFIGNSHSEHLPGALGALARASGIDLETEKVNPGGAQLIEHMRSPATLGALNRQKRDFVVLQEHSIVPGVPEHRQTEMLPAARKLCELARKQGARPVLYLTWARERGDPVNKKLFPADTYDKMQARVIEGYREVARDTGARLVPVGAAWQTVMRERPDIELFDPDGQHASWAGVHLAAAVFLASLFERDPAGIEESSLPNIPGLSEEQASYLRQVAKRTVSSFGR